MSVRRRDLGHLQEIDRGAVGVVHRVTGFKLPRNRVSLAYKEIRSDIQPAAVAQAARAMEASVAFRDSLTPLEQAELDRHACWPLSVVTDHGRTCGVLLPLIPDDFFATLRPTNGPSKRRVFNLSWLSAKESLVRDQGIDRTEFASTLVRIDLINQLVEAVALLHRNGLVAGDLSLKNAAIAAAPPRLLLLDCDAVARLDDPQRSQGHSPFFWPPEMVGPGATKRIQDQATDVYKLGLCVIRGLQHGEGVSQTIDPQPLLATLDQPTVDMVTRAVSPDPADRPTAQQLWDSLELFRRLRTQPPVLTYAAISRPMVVRGQDITVYWSVQGASAIQIESPNMAPIDIRDPAALTGPFTFRPSTSGEIRVRAHNRHGDVVVPAGQIELFELPDFTVDFTRIPRPQIASLPSLAMPDFPVAPIRLIATPGVPYVPAPDLSGLREAIAAVGPAGGGLGTTDPGIGTAGLAAAESLREVTREATAQTATVLASANEALRRAVERRLAIRNSRHNPSSP